MQQIRHHETSLLPIDCLHRHPHNRPLGINREKVDQLKESIRQYGFYDSQPIVVRLLPDGAYQIIKGEHRWIAAQELGFTEVPCSVQDMTDEEALIQLIIGNIQTENHPLEIGLNALAWGVEKSSKQGKDAKTYGENIGVQATSIQDYVRAATVYQRIKENKQNTPGCVLLMEVKKLVEIAKLPQTDWLWLHDFIVKNECSKQQVIAIVKTIRAFRDAVEDETWYAVLLQDVDVQVLAKDALLAQERKLQDLLTFLAKVKETLATLDETAIFYTFAEETEEILEETYNLHATFLSWLSKEEKRTVNAINQVYKRLRETQATHTKARAEAARALYQDNEMQRIREETRLTIIREWIELVSLEDIAKDVTQTVEQVQHVIDGYCQEHHLTHLTTWHGEFQTVCQGFQAESVDVILTDPPYPHEFLPLFQQLGEVAARVLKPGGSLFVMVGQSYLPDVMQMLGQSLTYHWTMAYLTPGGQSAQLWQRNINTFWKPILWFVKGTYAGKWAGDVAKSDNNDNDKTFHEWGQSLSGMKDLVNRCSEEGDLILDPFCGAGTTGVAAKQLQRHFIGIDVEKDYIITTRRRLYGV